MTEHLYGGSPVLDSQADARRHTIVDLRVRNDEPRAHLVGLRRHRWELIACAGRRTGPTHHASPWPAARRYDAAEQRRWAEARRAGFTDPPSSPNQVWQLNFSCFETTRAGSDAIEAVKLAVVAAEHLLSMPLLSMPRLEAVTDRGTGQIRPIARTKPSR